MPIQEMLVLAVTKMLGGVCIAGMTAEPDPVSRLRWVRPVRDHGHVFLGDITTPEGMVIRPFDVVQFRLLQPRPSTPHTEDCITDFVWHRPRVLRSLEGERRATFLSCHLDSAPHEVLEQQTRSLCLVKPDWVRGSFHLDDYSRDFDARLCFGLGGRTYLGTGAKGGAAVTDLKWRALGRAWLPTSGGTVEFDSRALREHLGIDEVYLALGLGRSYQGAHWLMAIGVHTVPDYVAVIDQTNP